MTQPTVSSTEGPRSETCDCGVDLLLQWIHLGHSAHLGLGYWYVVWLRLVLAWLYRARDRMYRQVAHMSHKPTTPRTHMCTSSMAILSGKPGLVAL